MFLLAGAVTGGAAESLGAKRVLGLEVDQEYAKNANVAMRNFRKMRKVSK